MRRRRLTGIIRQPGRRPAHIAVDARNGDDLRQTLIVRVDSLNAALAEPLPPPLPRVAMPGHPAALPPAAAVRGVQQRQEGGGDANDGRRVRGHRGRPPIPVFQQHALQLGDGLRVVEVGVHGPDHARVVNQHVDEAFLALDLRGHGGDGGRGSRVAFNWDEDAEA